ncbi:uncharacterized protein ALTATR162_LOCUS5131 [Alternaria atra]|uniref:Uncharacterized protein n=1 Tax=Alternaria atra TaxID=119953 RepID=A0A8J2I722_9PLEO|nr:uncharacterized protein ALTATR162_LOCUS5131 [Alternaria atra]CAG5158538.1 unnamed protein product [Alternaria atra]
MNPINLDNDVWSIDALKTALKSHTLFKRYGMEMPAKVLKKDLKSVARRFDQHDKSTMIADGKLPEPIAYDDGYYAVNADLRPMAEAAGMKNTHGKNFNKMGLAKTLIRWDVDHAPRVAIFLPRRKKEEKPDMPKRAVQTQNKTGVEPLKSKKRKAVPAQPSVPPKRQNKTKTTANDDDVEMSDEDESGDDGFLPQPAIKGIMSTRTLRQKQTPARKPRKGQAIAPQTHIGANKNMHEVTYRQVDEDEEGDPRDDAAGHADEEDDEEFKVDAGELQWSSTKRRALGRLAARGEKPKKKPTKADQARPDPSEDGTQNTAERHANEQQEKDDEEKGIIHNAHRLGGYNTSALADTFRVKNKTVHAHMEGHIRPGVEPAPTDQLGTWRLYERYVDLAKREGRDPDLWMGGGASP